MGIVLYAQVEVLEADPFHRTRRLWWEMSRWSLGKDGLAQVLVLNECHEGHPEDAHLSETEKMGIDQGKRWIAAEDLPLFVDATLGWQSLQASLVPYVGVQPCRVLFWEM
jgi:hypothetical protein